MLKKKRRWISPAPEVLAVGEFFFLTVFFDHYSADQWSKGIAVDGVPVPKDFVSSSLESWVCDPLFPQPVVVAETASQVCPRDHTEKVITGSHLSSLLAARAAELRRKVNSFVSLAKVCLVHYIYLLRLSSA